MSFFIRKRTRGAGTSGHDRPNSKSKNEKKVRMNGFTKHEKYSKKNVVVNDPANIEIESGSEIESDIDVSDNGANEQEPSDINNIHETAQEKKLRLTKKYLADLVAEEQKTAERDEDDDEGDRVAARLRDEVLEQTGKLQRKLADSYSSIGDDVEIRLLKGHRLSVTCLVVSSDNKVIFSGSKDGAIIKWNTESGRKLAVIPSAKKEKPGKTSEKSHGHVGNVLCLALSNDDEFLASGGKDKVINIWRASTCCHLHTFNGHRDSISGLTFRRNTHTLYSSSNDRSVKIWSLDEMMYVETLFGHQDVITSIDSLVRERCITSGARDGSIRIWKIVEESQLVFLGHRGCIDCVRLINEDHFVSGGDDGSIGLWSSLKKKPLHIHQNAHYLNNKPPPSLPASVTSGDECWITSVASLPFSDLVASGSRDGKIRLWKCGEDYKSLTQLSSITLNGFINDLRFTTDGMYLAVAVGQEHKLGRWWKVKNSKNSVAWIKLK